MTTSCGGAEQSHHADAGGAPQTNTNRIAQMLGMSVTDVVFLWKDIQAHLQEPLPLSAAVVAIGRLVAQEAQPSVGAREIAGFIVAERAAEREAAEREKRLREEVERQRVIAERQAWLRRRRKKSPVVVAAAVKAERIERRLAAVFAARMEKIKVSLAQDYARRLVAAQNSARATLDSAEKRAVEMAEKLADARHATALKTEEANRLHAVELTTRRRADAAQRGAEAAEKRAVAAEEALAAERVAAQRLLAEGLHAARQAATVEPSQSAAGQTSAEERAMDAPKPTRPRRFYGLSETHTAPPAAAPPKGPAAQPKASAAPLRVASTRATEIRKICEEQDIQRVVHFTHVDNLGGILTQGLLGRSRLESGVGAARPHFNDTLRLDGYKEAICLSISFPNYAMFYKYSFNDRSKWTVLLLSPSLLWETDCAFCHGNAASNGVRSVPLPQRRTPGALRQMFAESESTQRAYLGVPASYPTDPQAEVLAFEPLGPAYIREVHFYSIETARAWLGANPSDYEARFQFRGGPALFERRQDIASWGNAAPAPAALRYGQHPVVAPLVVDQADVMDDPFADA